MLNFVFAYSVDSYFSVSCSRLVPRFGKTAVFPAINNASLLCGFFSEVFPLPLDACDSLRHFIVTLPGPSI